MFSFIKNLLGRSPNQAPIRPGSRPAPVRTLSKAPPLVATTLTEHPAAAPSAPSARQPAKQGSRPAPHTLAMAAEAKGDVVVPMKLIVDRLPDHLKVFVTMKAMSANITIPMGVILPQLATGSVRLTFADFVELAPDGACRADRSVAGETVEIPLGAIVPQLTPQQLRRRGNQRPPNLPPEIESPFTVNGVDKAAVGATKPRVVQLPNATGRSVVYAPPQAESAEFHAQIPPEVVPLSPPAPLQPVAQTSSLEYVRDNEQVTPPFRPSKAPSPKAEDAYVPPPEPVLPPATPIRPSFSMACPPTPAIPRIPAPVAMPALQQPLPTPVPEPAVARVPSLAITVQSLAEGLPASLQNILMQRPGATFHLPLEYLEPAIKAGKVYFAWGQLSEYLVPSWPAATHALPSGTVVDLPLSAIVPLFLAQLQRSRPKKAAPIDPTIPNPFKDGRTAQTAEAPAQAPEPSPIRPEPAPFTPQRAATPAFHSAPQIRGASPSTLGGLDDSRLRPDASLQELLRDMASLPGVTGALLATQDGLLVAVQLPRHLAPETVAAIVPQIYEKTIFYTQHLSFTPSRHLTLVLENLTLQIVRSGRLYLTLLAEPGFQLTPDQLLSLASQIESQHQPA